MLVSSRKPLKIVTESFTTFSLRAVEINVWSAPDKPIFKVVFVISTSSEKLDNPIIKLDAEYVTLEPDTELVNVNEQSVILTGVLKPKVIK